MVSKPFLLPIERIFGLRDSEHHHVHEAYKPTIIIFGVNNISAESIELLAQKKELLVIERNPKKLLSYHERGINTICSDVYNIDLYEEIIDFKELKTVVSVIDDANANLFLLKKIRQLNKDALTIIIASLEDQGKKLYRAGANLVLVPDLTGRRILSETLTGGPQEVLTIGKLYFKELEKNFVYMRE